MERITTKAYYCICWNSFFPDTPVPNTDKEYIQAVICAGLALFDEHITFRSGYLHCPITYKVTVDDLMRVIAHYKKMEDFSLNLIAFYDELPQSFLSKKQDDQLDLVFTKIDNALQELIVLQKNWEKTIEEYSFDAANEDGCQAPVQPGKTFIFAYGIEWEVILN